jgi:hypothetical protein
VSARLVVDDGDIRMQRDFLYRLGWHLMNVRRMRFEHPNEPDVPPLGYIEVHADADELTSRAILWYLDGMPMLLEHRLLEVAVAVGTGKVGPPLEEWPQYERDSSGHYRYLAIQPPTEPDADLLDDAGWIAPWATPLPSTPRMTAGEGAKVRDGGKHSRLARWVQTARLGR